MRKGENERMAPGKFDVKGPARSLIWSTTWSSSGRTCKESKEGQETDTKDPDAFVRIAKQRHHPWEGSFAYWFDKDSQQFLEAGGPADLHRRAAGGRVITIGIDPGLSGRLRGAGPQRSARGVRPAHHADPQRGDRRPGAAQKVDGLALASLLRQHIPPGEPVTAAVEAVSAMGGKNNSIQTQGSLMRTLGAIEAVLECFYPVVYAYPQIWKKFCGLIDPNARTPSARARPWSRRARCTPAAPTSPGTGTTTAPRPS